MNNIIRFAPATLTLAILSTLYQSAHAAEDPLADGETMVVQATAEEALKQQPGVSIITAKDIEKDPPVNDLSEIIRKMPGVNSPETARQAAAVTTARSTSAVWGRRTR